MVFKQRPGGLPMSRVETGAQSELVNGHETMPVQGSLADSSHTGRWKRQAMGAGNLGSGSGSTTD